LAFEIPWGYELQIRMRSGIAKKTKLRMPNGMGTVDSDYRGEVFVMLENTGDFVYDDDGWEKVDYYFLAVAGERVPDENYEVYHEGAYVVRKGDRIAQGIIAPVMRAVFEEADDLSETDRGSGGFGSTGVRG